jgi:hypothetical protein
MTTLITLCVLVFGLGACGVFVRGPRLRIVVWAVSALVSAFGFIVWSGGGMGEGFSALGMTLFVAAAFWPLLGCALGEAVNRSLRHRATLTRREN